MHTGDAHWHWNHRVPRWLIAWLVFASMSGLALLLAQLTHNWTIAPTAAFVGGVSGPVALATWLTDRTGIGRSVRPDLLFMVAVAGGAFAIVAAALFQTQTFVHLNVPEALNVAVTEELAKVTVPILICVALPRYRSPEQAVALAVSTAAGFAAFESMTYALTAADKSLVGARDLLFERSVVTPFGHLPWTVIAVAVAATEWKRRGRVALGPKSRWGLLVAIVLHAAWNTEVGRPGHWVALGVVNGAITFGLFVFCIRDLRYTGPYQEPPASHLPKPTRREGQ
jgi:RsiW-degrading membrane proteinase PrsW (M82 family)